MQLLLLLICVHLTEAHRVLLISIDGFRHEYLGRGLTPNLLHVIEKGVSFPIEVEFPSETMPNHATMMTGMHPASHGIVRNSFYDIAHDKVLRIDSEDAMCPSVSPLWARTKAAMFCWPGCKSDAMENSVCISPAGCYTKNSGVDIIDTVIDWLNDPKSSSSSFNLIAVYIAEIDQCGHEYGPESTQLKEALTRVDGKLKKLLDKATEEDINIVIVSDHGMTELSKTIVLEEYIKNIQARAMHIMGGPVTLIYPKVGETDKLYAELEAAFSGNDLVKVYRKNKLFKEFNYVVSERISEIVLVAKNGCTIVPIKRDKVLKGMHGYDPRNPDMRAIFIAAGPQIACKEASNTVYNLIDVHILLYCLLDLLEPNDQGSENLSMATLKDYRSCRLLALSEMQKRQRSPAGIKDE